MIWNETVAVPGERPQPWLGRLTWVTWRQHRGALIGLGIFLGAVSLAIAIAGLRLHQLNDQAVRDGCVGQFSWTAQCRALVGPFYVGWPLRFENTLEWYLPLVPVSIGMFLGATLFSREYETGTNQFAWTQDAGRLRPVLTKVVLLGLAVLAVAAVVGWLAQWSVAPVIARSGDQFDRWEPDLFDATPITEAAFAGLCYTGGLLTGALTRRVVPAVCAVATAAVVFAVVSFDSLHFWLLSHGLRRSQDLALGLHEYSGTVSGGLINVHRTTGAGAPGPAGRWLDQGWYAGPGGHRLSAVLQERLLYNPHLVTGMHATFWVTYQPGSRYLLFQSVQGGGELLIALLFGALAVRLVQRRDA